MTVSLPSTVWLKKFDWFLTDITYLLRWKLQPELKGEEPDPLYYRITDSTQIAKVNMRRLLSHSNTKMELTVYLAQKSMEYAVQNGRRFVVSWACQCEATHQKTEHLQSHQEEADTKLILHPLDATANGASTLKIHSPDTDVFVLSHLLRNWYRPKTSKYKLNANFPVSWCG